MQLRHKHRKKHTELTVVVVLETFNTTAGYNLHLSRPVSHLTYERIDGECTLTEDRSHI